MFPREYALANDVDYPRTVYVREDEIIGELDAWLARLFDPEQLEATCETLAAAPVDGPGDEAARAAAQRSLDDCDERLKRYRAGLDHGAAAVIVAGWIGEVQGERLRALGVLSRAQRAAFTRPTFGSSLPSWVISRRSSPARTPLEGWRLRRSGDLGGTRGADCPQLALRVEFAAAPFRQRRVETPAPFTVRRCGPRTAREAHRPDALS